MTEEKQTSPRPNLTVHVVVFTLAHDRGSLSDPRTGPAELHALFVRRKSEPFQDAWELPGGLCGPNETIEQAVARGLQEVTGLEDLYFEEVKTFSTLDRDPRDWVVTVAHLAIIPVDRAADVNLKSGDGTREATWLRITSEKREGMRIEQDGALAGPFAFDHENILAAAMVRLRERVDMLAFEFLLQPFALSAAQRAFEAILGEPLDPVTFPRYLVRAGLAREVTLSDRADSPWSRYLSGPVRRKGWLEPPSSR